MLVTGASSGMGYDVARMLASEGYEVYGAARRVALMEPLKEFGVTPVALDVSSPDSISACLEVVGAVDVLVNCAGYGSFGAIENVPDAEARRQLEVNVFGLAALCRAVIPGMRERGYGRIVNISSVAGRACLYFGGWYNVSKYSVDLEFTQTHVHRISDAIQSSHPLTPSSPSALNLSQHQGLFE